MKVPKILSDLYQDLRDRHLLPLVAVLAVAIVVVPIALGESGGSDEEASPESGLATISNAGAPARNVVSKEASGLRRYQSRLSHRSPEDPFKQQYTSEVREESSEEPAEPSGEPTGEPAPVEGGEPSSEPSSEPIVTNSLKYFTYKIDVRVVPVSTNGVPSEAEPTVHRNLPELSKLPGRETPALVFMQPSSDGKKALMLVNSDVKAIFGDGVCASGGDTCELLALQPGQPETIVYGANERIFRIELLKVNLVFTDKLEKAPLGNPKSGG